jgi:hypothetical protein
LGTSCHDVLKHDPSNRHLPQDDLGNGLWLAVGHSLKFAVFFLTTGVPRPQAANRASINGKAAGCHVIAITTSFGEELLRKAGADQVVHNFKSFEDCWISTRGRAALSEPALSLPKGRIARLIAEMTCSVLSNRESRPPTFHSYARGPSTKPSPTVRDAAKARAPATPHRPPCRLPSSPQCPASA